MEIPGQAPKAKETQDGSHTCIGNDVQMSACNAAKHGSSGQLCQYALYDVTWQCREEGRELVIKLDFAPIAEVVEERHKLEGLS